MNERKYPDDLIKDCAKSILGKFIPEHNHDIWDIIGEDVVNRIKKDMNANDAHGFYEYHVKVAIGEALYKHIKN